MRLGLALAGIAAVLACGQAPAAEPELDPFTGLKKTGDWELVRNNCVSCHPHDYDSVPTSADAFMPQQCNACHSYPVLASGGSDHTLSAVHNIHAGAPDGGPFEALSDGRAPDGRAFDFLAFFRPRGRQASTCSRFWSSSSV